MNYVCFAPERCYEAGGSCSFAGFNGDQKERNDDRKFRGQFQRPSIHAALELSKDSWLLAIRVPGRDNPSPRPIKGGDGDGRRSQGISKAGNRLARVALVRSGMKICSVFSVAEKHGDVYAAIFVPPFEVDRIRFVK